MDTSNDVFIFKGHTGQITAKEILASGKFFSGMVFQKNVPNSWIEFNLVNEDKMKYILNGINFKEEVKIEIFAYAKYPKTVQRLSDWDKSRKK